MTFEEYKEKIFKERPEVKAEYDSLEEEFEVKLNHLRECLNNGDSVLKSDKERESEIEIRRIFPE